MIRVRNGNVILQVPEYTANHYLGLGYDIINSSGEVVEKAVPTDIGVLQQFYITAHAKVVELNAEVDRLTAENIALKAAANDTPAKKTRKAKSE